VAEEDAFTFVYPSWLNWYNDARINRAMRLALAASSNAAEPLNCG